MTNYCNICNKICYLYCQINKYKELKINNDKISDLCIYCPLECKQFHKMYNFEKKDINNKIEIKEIIN